MNYSIKVIVVLISLIFFIPVHICYPQQNNFPKEIDISNPDFEDGEINKVPPGWRNTTEKYGYPSIITDQNPFTNKKCALIYNVPVHSNFGNLMQTLDAKLFRGKRLRFKAAVRTESDNFSGQAQLWLRVDRNNGEMGFFDNMGNRPIRSNKWNHYEINAVINDDAMSINFGVMLIGTGKVWIDDVLLEEIAASELLDTSPRPLSDEGLENLIAFCKLYGYIKHFHPSDEASAVNWDEFAVNVINSAENAHSPQELKHILDSLFRPIAPTLSIYLKGEQPPDNSYPLTPSGERDVTLWYHKGFRSNTAKKNVYSSSRVIKKYNELSELLADPSKPFSAEPGRGLYIKLPLALFKDSAGTLPHTGFSYHSKGDMLYSGNDRATRLADVIIIWNIIQHFYPYFDVVNVDWINVLRESLKEAAADKNEKEFLKTLRKMIAKIRDGHGGVYANFENNDHILPLQLEVVENKLVITQRPDNAPEIQAGDAIEKINDKPTEEIIKEAKEYISGATEQWKDILACYYITTGQKESEVSLQVKSYDGKERMVVMKRSIRADSSFENRPAKISLLKEKMYYIDLSRITDGEFTAVIDSINKARGVIFDVRGYPSVSPVVISHIIDKPVMSAKWNIPIVTMPDHIFTEFDTSGRWNVSPLAPRINCKIVFLTNGRAISYAESFLGIVEAYKLGEIVGEPTAGTNGNVNPVSLPGGYTVAWTGMKVIKHDGSIHHTAGIKPTHLVTKTIKGISEGRDEQLEYAIKLFAQ